MVNFKLQLENVAFFKLVALKSALVKLQSWRVLDCIVFNINDFD